MKYKKLIPLLSLVLASSLFAGSQVWSLNGSYNNWKNTTNYFNTTATTEFVASLSGYGAMGGTSRAFDGSQTYAHVEGTFYWGTNISDSGTAPAGKSVVIYQVIGGYEPGGYGNSTVSATW